MTAPAAGTGGDAGTFSWPTSLWFPAHITSHADTFPLKVANPKPAEWTPPAPGDKPARKAKKKPAAAKKPADGEQPTGRIRVDSNLHFTNWDSNKDDYVTLVEFQLGQKNRKGLEATFKSYDKNGDGRLSREEYVDPRVLQAPAPIHAAEPTSPPTTRSSIPNAWPSWTK